MLDIQKASILKRISAWILDVILLATLAVGAGWGLTSILGYDKYADEVNEKLEYYAELYGVDSDITKEEFDKLSDDEKALYEIANKAVSEDEDLKYLYNMMFNLTLIIVTFSILIAYLLLEFVVPLMFGNGQTVGKKVFGIGIIRCDGIKVSVFMMFVRTLLGKFTIETMIPALLLIMSYFGIIGFEGLIIIAVMIFVQLAMLIVTKDHSVIHDKFAQSTVVDLSSQMIFESVEELTAYKNKLHEEKAKSNEGWRL